MIHCHVSVVIAAAPLEPRNDNLKTWFFWNTETMR